MAAVTASFLLRRNMTMMDSMMDAQARMEAKVMAARPPQGNKLALEVLRSMALYFVPNICLLRITCFRPAGLCTAIWCHDELCPHHSHAMNRRH